MSLFKPLCSAFCYNEMPVKVEVYQTGPYDFKSSDAI